MKLLALIILLTSCAGSNVRKNLDEIYQGAGVEQYFLPDLPGWANFSTLGGCHRSDAVRYLDFQNVGRSYAMDYEQIIQLQFLYNRQMQAMMAETGKKLLNSEDESFLFYNSYEQIIGGGRDFVIPTYERVHVVWIDPALADKAVEKRLQNFMESKIMELGHPVFMSFCLSFEELEKYIQKNNYNRYGVKALSMEMMSNYGSDFQLRSYESVELSKLMPGKKIYFFAPNIPEQFSKIPNTKSY